METVDKFLVLLFGAIIVGLIVTNPNGMTGFFQGLGSFTSSTVKAFQGFSSQSGTYSPNLTMMG